VHQGPEKNIGKYQQLYIILPAKICEVIDIEKGAEIETTVTGKDSLLLKVAR